MIWNIRKQKHPIRTTTRGRIQKIEDGIRSLWDNLRGPTFASPRVPEGKEKEQEIVNLFEKIMKENFLDLVKEIDMQVQEAQRFPKRTDAKRPTPRHIIIKMLKFQEKERILKTAREKQLVTYRGVPIGVSADFQKKLCSLEGIGKTYSKS